MKVEQSDERYQSWVAHPFTREWRDAVAKEHKAAVSNLMGAAQQSEDAKVRSLALLVVELAKWAKLAGGDG